MIVVKTSVCIDIPRYRQKLDRQGDVHGDCLRCFLTACGKEIYIVFPAKDQIAKDLSQ